MEKVPYAEFFMGDGSEPSDNPSTPEISAVEQLMNKFESHEEQEGEFIQQYKEVAGRSKNPLVKFLLNLIISDEEKHRAAIHAIVTTLKSDLTWTKQEDSFQGFGGLDKEGEGKDLLRLTADFIQHEKEGIRDYKILLKSSEGYYFGVFELLLHSIIRDSEKHVEILEFLSRKLREE